MDFHLVPIRPQSNPRGNRGGEIGAGARAGLTPVDSKEKETRQTWKPMPIMIISSFELLLKRYFIHAHIWVLVSKQQYVHFHPCAASLGTN